MKSELEHRLHVEVCGPASGRQELAKDVRAGLCRSPKSLPPKYFYDERGAKLFDAICDTPEYYPTRSEQALLARIAPQLIEQLAPSDLVELGSGSARKTRTLLDAVSRLRARARYVPFDVSEEMLRASSRQLLEEYPWLEVRAMVGDYDRDLDRLPPGERRLFLFLGGTIGNFEVGADAAFLGRIARQMQTVDRLLLGTDLIKDERTLSSAYNDARGVTAAFNLNVLQVVNRELGGRFDPSAFEHVAFYDPERQRIEMHLRSRRAHDVRIDGLGISVHFERGETILTEISRKFSRASVEALLGRAGLALCEWFLPADGAFALSLARRA
jgi:L-histidine Nalpha-methyltransferase